ncbi:MAG: hypothetical protein ACI4GA_02110 [Acutalibacteraceae bacterium]|nr:hypothetical protein [Oscillospiraceae bacterium]
MRCNECNVDLGEEYTKCPLCGADAVADEPKLKGLKTAEYPKYSKELLSEKPKYKQTFPEKHVFRICFCVCVAFGVAAIFSFKPLWNFGVPALMAASSLFYFISGLKEKGRLLHSALSLLSSAAALVLFTAAAAISGTGLKYMLLALAFSVLLFVVLAIARPERMKEQLKAAFSL